MSEIKQYVLQQRIFEVEARIAEVTSQKEKLEENAKKSKSEVHQSVGRQMERLRQREVQLTRQVDALMGHPSTLLQLQLAKLYQELGSLRAAQAFNSLPQVDNHTSPLLSPVVSVHHLQYTAPTEKELSSDIQSFGRFEATRGSSCPSVPLLPDEEAYEDADHQLMHKNLLQEKMLWSFPKPPSKADDCNLSMKMEDFEMSDSESIELLCLSETQEKAYWLLNNDKSLSKSCHCQEKGTIEIENLDSLSCASNRNEGKEESMDDSFSIPEVTSTCQSPSSKCSSFRDCSCTENCLLLHLREQTKRLWLEEPQKKQDCINNTLKEAFRAERSVWLNKNPKTNSNSEWLLKSSTMHLDENWLAQNKSCQSLKKQMKELYFDSGNSGWLLTESIESNQGWIKQY